MNIYRKEPTSLSHYNLSLSTCIQNMNFLCYTFVEISLTKNMERKKKELIQGRTNRRRLILNPTIQLAIVNLYIKYEVSILNGFRDIFDKNYSTKCMERKKSEHIPVGKNKQEKAGFLSHYITCQCQPVYKV